MGIRLHGDRPKEEGPPPDPPSLREDGALVIEGDAYHCRRLGGESPGGWRCLMRKEGEAEGAEPRTVEASPSGVWRCSCDGWRFRGKCRHVRLGKAYRALQAAWRAEGIPAKPEGPGRLPPGGLLAAHLGGEKQAQEARERMAKRARAESLLRREYAEPQPSPAAAFDAERFRESLLSDMAKMVAQAAQQGGKRG